MKSFLRSLFTLWGRWRLQQQSSELRTGRGSQVYFWRIRSCAKGCLVVGNQSRVETRITIERPGACVIVGDRSFIGQGQISCAGRIEVGNDVMIAWGTTIFDHGSHSLRFSLRSGDVVDWLRGEKNWEVVNVGSVKIGDKAWVGFGSILLPGINVGEGSIIGAGSVVTRDVPAWTVVAGNPARVIRELGENER